MKQPSTTVKNRDVAIDLMRILGAIALIVLHVGGLLVISYPLKSHSWQVGNLLDSASRWPVPLFVMISGYLLLEPCRTTNIKDFYKRRFLRIAPLIIIWPILYIFWSVFFLHANFDITIWYQSMLVGSPHPGHLHFLFLILGLYAVAPFLSIVIQKLNRNSLWIMIIIIMAITTVSHAIDFWLLGGGTPVNLLTRWIPYLGYFILGYGIKITDIRLRLPHIFICLAVLIIAVAGLNMLFMSHYGLSRGLYFYDCPNPLIMMMSFLVFCGFYKLFKLARLEKYYSHNNLSLLINRLGQFTLGVYLVHYMVLDVIIRYTSPLTANAVLLTVVNVIGTIIGSFLVVYIYFLALSIIKSLLWRLKKLRSEEYILKGKA
jgi:surface polysaccharide O-acyltransferase-like enzyme